MPSRREFALGSVASALCACGSSPNETRQAKQRSAPRNQKLGSLRIDAATDQHEVEDLLDLFREIHPSIAIEYHRPASSDLHASFLREASEGRPTADLIISSAMDLQFKLVNDAYAQPYESPEIAHLPSWAVWKNEAYAVTAEPIVFTYNRRLMPPDDVPTSHDALADLLRRKSKEYTGKITSYDPERSGTGYLYYTQDLLLSRDTIDLSEAVGRTKPTFYVSGVEIIDKVSQGQHILAYNMMSSYVLERQAHDSNIGIIFPNDYTLVMSRIAFIPKTARNPEASRLFLDLLLSEQGQSLLARRHMQPVRADVSMGGETAPPDILRPIPFGPSLLANLDQYRRRRVLREWHRTFSS